MATSKQCSICQKGAGTYFCTGCEVYFCKKDFHSHRETLNNQLYGYIEDRNALQEKISKIGQEKNLHNPYLLQIDEWEKATTEKVRQAAEQARQKVIQITNSKRTEITSEFEKFSKELIEVKETEDFAEKDLKRLKETIQRFNQDLKQLAQPNSIELHMEESQTLSWNRLIYVTEETNYGTKQARSRRDATEPRIPATPSSNKIHRDSRMPTIYVL